MKLRIDTSRSYALALEGGGAKGAYQIGAWKALREAGVKIDAVAGTSVGALNGSLIVMGDLEKAERVYSWFVKSCGGGFENVMTPERIQAILKEKAESGLLS